MKLFDVDLSIKSIHFEHDNDAYIVAFRYSPFRGFRDIKVMKRCETGNCYVDCKTQSIEAYPRTGKLFFKDMAEWMSIFLLSKGL